ncbi:MAG: hypothetical protein NZ898_13500 [Myxococcota bacterium]|nr:hypothetical protein [Myxococcota bacterium]MDW8361963.1 UshA-like (seleno)protein [Myxococcales bacterium]
MRPQPFRRAASWPALLVAMAWPVLTAAWCASLGHTESGRHAERPPPDLRVFVLTDVHGYLEPCGCTSRPLGGVDRLAARLRARTADGRPWLLVAAGDLLFERHGHSEHARVQERMQAETFVDVMNRIGLLAAAPGRSDLDADRTELAALVSRARFALLGAGVASSDGELGLLRPHLVHDVGGVRVGLLGLVRVPDGSSTSGDPNQRLLEAARASVRAVREAGAQIVIALASVDRRLVRRVVSELDGVDLVVQGGLDRAEPLPPSEAGAAHILHAGRHGQRLLVVEVWRSARGAGLRDVSAWTRQVRLRRLRDEMADLEVRIARWRAQGRGAHPDVRAQQARLDRLRLEAASSTHGPVPALGGVFDAWVEELEPDAERDPEIRGLMIDLARRINEHNRHALAHLRPPPVPNGQPRYLGSESCGSCHEPAYRWWRSTPHGRAYATLVSRHKQYNLHCVGCHVTGYGRPGGATVTHNLDGALVDVGCESCHGPGSAHAQQPERAGLVARDAPEALCVECHNPEHSDRFHYGVYRSMLIVPGHGRPLVAAR